MFSDFAGFWLPKGSAAIPEGEATGMTSARRIGDDETQGGGNAKRVFVVHWPPVGVLMAGFALCCRRKVCLQRLGGLFAPDGRESDGFFQFLSECPIAKQNPIPLR